MRRLVLVICVAACAPRQQVLWDPNAPEMPTAEDPDNVGRVSTSFGDRYVVKPDGTIRSGLGVLGRIEPDGSVRNALGLKVGRVDEDGIVRGDWDARVGRVDAKGVIRDGWGFKVGRVTGDDDDAIEIWERGGAAALLVLD